MDGPGVDKHRDRPRPPPPRWRPQVSHGRNLPTSAVLGQGGARRHPINVAGVRAHPLPGQLPVLVVRRTPGFAAIRALFQRGLRRRFPHRIRFAPEKPGIAAAWVAIVQRRKGDGVAGFTRVRVEVLGPVIGEAAARACARRDLLRLVAFGLGWLALVPTATWAQMSHRPLAWVATALSGAAALGVFAASMVAGHHTIVAANTFVGARLGYPVRLGSNLNVREWKLAIEREKTFHAQGGRPTGLFWIYRAPKDDAHR